MQTPKVEETKKSASSQQVILKGLLERPCIYFKEAECKVPKLQFKICMRCPRAAQYIKNKVLNSLFDHIKGLAILLLSSMGISSSGSSGAGMGGSAGGGAGGGGGGGGGGGS